jgi:hypothetical protein
MTSAFKVLAIDGGGIRGIIPAFLLAEIEDLTQRQIYEFSRKARARPDDDLPMREVARATSAAPTYFTPARVDTRDPLIIDIVINGSNATVDYQLQQVLQPGGPEQTYFRFQVELSHDTGDMDDASPHNLKRLIDLTQNYLAQPDTRDKLKRLCDRLAA